MLLLHVACNDPDNGAFAYRAPALQLGAKDLCEFEAFHEPGPRFLETSKGFRLAGKNWETGWSADWVGNWCWNAYRLYPPKLAMTQRWYLVDFLTWLKGRQLYQLSTGPSRLFAWWRDDLHLSPAELHTEICDLEFGPEQKPTPSQEVSD